MFWTLLAAVLLGMAVLTVPAFSESASAQDLRTDRPAQRSDHGSVGLFQMQVGGAPRAGKTRKLPKTNTLCAPIGSTRPQARC